MVIIAAGLERGKVSHLIVHIVWYGELTRTDRLGGGEKVGKRRGGKNKKVRPPFYTTFKLRSGDADWLNRHTTHLGVGWMISIHSLTKPSFTTCWKSAKGDFLPLYAIEPMERNRTFFHDSCRFVFCSHHTHWAFYPIFTWWPLQHVNSNGSPFFHVGERLLSRVIGVCGARNPADLFLLSLLG